MQGVDVVMGVHSREGRDRQQAGSLALQALIDASRDARAVAHRVLARSDVLCKRAVVAQRKAVDARLRSRPGSRYARVEGTVDGRPSVAVVHRDGSVVGERSLLRRVDVVVALGDTFGDGRTTASVGDDPLISTLSAARACDSVSSIDVFGPEPPKARLGRSASKDGPSRACPLVVGVERGEGHVALRLEGELDVGTAEDVVAELDNCGAEDADVVVDLSEVTFIDARGVSVLVTARDALAVRGRALVVRGAKGAVRRMLQMCEATELFGD